MSGNSRPMFFFGSDRLTAQVKTDEQGRKTYYLEGYVATGDLDKGDDIITNRALDDIYRQFKNGNLKLDFEHESLIGDSRLDAQRALTKSPLGKATMAERDEKGVKVGWELNNDWHQLDEKKNVVRDTDWVWRQVQNGFYDGFSIGYIPKEVENPERKGDGIRRLNRIKMLTSALTGTPMNPEAERTRAFAKSLKWLTKQKGGNMAEEDNKTQAEGKAENAEAEAKGAEPSEELIEVKSRLEALEKKTQDYEHSFTEMKSELEAKSTELAEAKKDNAELKEVVEKARHKAIQQGVADKKSAENTQAEGKSRTMSLGELLS